MNFIFNILFEFCFQFCLNFVSISFSILFSNLFEFYCFQLRLQYDRSILHDKTNKKIDRYRAYERDTFSR
jgi:hypothetical protein